MKLYAPAAFSALFLVSCGQDQSPQVEPTSAAREQLPPEVPVMGKELRVLALGDSLFAGYGVKREESYPARLEAALLSLIHI